MSRVHDMGGRFGDGPVRPHADERSFDAEWHGRALAITLACGALGQWNLDGSRHARERLNPKDYTRCSYYEKWLAALTDLLVEAEIIATAEITGEMPAQKSTLSHRRLPASKVEDVLRAGGPTARQSSAVPRFQVGDTVQTRLPAENTLVPGGHTRLPSYAAGAHGRVLRIHGPHVFPDSHAHGLGEQPEPLYAVAFPAAVLWAHPEHPEDEVVMDLWESYLVTEP
ncbi:MAG: nitrile hydratase subunit beta [Pseudomonadota bacterium]